jgi:mRNA interferase RelE/StbE
MYRISFKKSAQKELASIPKPHNKSIADAIDKLANNPRPDGVKKLKGDYNAYRIRVGDYRVIYTIEDEIKIIEIQRIRHRKEAYK